MREFNPIEFRESENNGAKNFLREYLHLEDQDLKKISFIKAGDLPGVYKAQYEALNDARLENITMAIIPDDFWRKSQPTESSAGNNLILIKQGYFENQENPDELAWTVHELAHCQKFLDSESAEAYQKDMETFAFEDLGGEYPYPNSLVEEWAFGQQLQYLLSQGKSQEEILKMLSQEYTENEMPFFVRIMDNLNK